jgi:crotonobetainyl-CoA:carnitine CoA-transferase CaiB-like acyl-CoA transferase
MEQSSAGPLAGIRVLDLTAVLMGPSATQLLADLGADVIKIESPQGDATRTIGPGSDDKMGAIFLSANRNKRSVVLDLKSTEGRSAFLALAAKADVVTCNVRPAAMERLGLTYEALCEVNPRIVYVSMIGFSQRGPYARSPAFDDLIQGAIGTPHAMAAAGDGSLRYVPLNIADRSVGLYAFGVITTALYARERTGRGQRIDVPMFETMVPYVLGDHLYGHKFVPPRGDVGYPRILARTRMAHRTLDGVVSCTIYHDHHWRAFLKIIGHPEWMQTDPRLATLSTRVAHSEELEELVKSELARRTTAEWTELLREADVPVFPVHTFESLLDDPHLNAIGFFREESVPSMGTIRETSVPSEWHGTPPAGYRPPPTLGEHTVQVLADAGLEPDAIDAVLAANAAWKGPSGPGR